MGTNFIGRLAIGILLVAFLVAGFGYLSTQKKLTVAESSLVTADQVKEVALFNKMFVEKVLASKAQMSFDDRLELENSVRKLSDVEILRLWRAFTNSKSDADAQVQVKDLLQLLAAKMVE